MKNNGMEGRKAEPIWSLQAMLPVRYIAKFALKPLHLEDDEQGRIGRSLLGKQTGKFPGQHISSSRLASALTSGPE